MSQSTFIVPKLSAVALTILLAGCDQGSSVDGDGGVVFTPADGGGLVTMSSPPTCIGTMASFTSGIRQDLAAALAPEQRDRNNDPAVDGVAVTRGYGVDLAILTTGFLVGHPGIPEQAAPADPTLTFGGWTSISSGRDPLAFRAAEQMWAALAGASEKTEGATDASTTTRTTPGGRVACGRQTTTGGTLSVHCVLTGFLYLEAAEYPCQ